MRTPRQENINWAKTKATKSQWALVDVAIKEYVRKYPLEWLTWQKSVKYDREAQKDTLRKRTKGMLRGKRVATFPVVFNKKGEVIDGLLPVLEKIIPKLTHSQSVNFWPFLKKYPMFRTWERSEQWQKKS